MTAQSRLAPVCRPSPYRPAAAPGPAPADRVATLESFRRYRATGDRDVRNDIVLAHAWIADHCARRFAHRGEPLGDLVQVARLAIVKAVERFDPDVGTSFPSFAIPTVLGELRRHFRDATWTMSASRRIKDLVSPLNAAVERLSHRLDRSPRAEEVAAELGVDTDTVIEVMEAGQAYRPHSLQHGAGVADRPASETLGGDDPQLAGAALRVTTLRALRRLDPRSRRIVLWRFYEGCTQQEIGDRLGIGQVHVSRLLRAALAKTRTLLPDDLDGAAS